MSGAQSPEAYRSLGIQRKVGKGLRLGQLAGLMRCKCGHKGTQLMVRQLTRD